MRYVTATEAKQRLGALIDAAQREPIMIRKQKRDIAVLLSSQEYERIRAFNREAFLEFCERVGSNAAVRGLNERTLAEILKEDG